MWWCRGSSFAGSSELPRGSEDVRVTPPVAYSPCIIVSLLVPTSCTVGCCNSVVVAHVVVIVAYLIFVTGTTGSACGEIGPYGKFSERMQKLFILVVKLYILLRKIVHFMWRKIEPNIFSAEKNEKYEVLEV